MAEAQSKIGMAFYLRRGVPQNYVQAHVWSNLAANQGDEEAQKVRDVVAEMMTPDQIAKAKKLAQKWLKEHGK